MSTKPQELVNTIHICLLSLSPTAPPSCSLTQPSSASTHSALSEDLPVNDAGAVTAGVTVGCVLAGAIGESAGEKSSQWVMTTTR